jgi:hypothetical protein
VLVAVAVVVIIAGIGAWFLLRGSGEVDVTVVNRSHQSIASVRLEHEDGIERHGRIAKGDSAKLHFAPTGESSYRPRVRMADGSQLTGGGGYVEAGYRFTETVTEKGIDTEMKTPGEY